jgi:sigma-B regulation protein RsbU (phosphoserine phosphatase)
MMEARAVSLVVVSGGERTVVEGQVSAGAPFTIGRSAEMDLVLPYAFLSRRQAEIVVDESGGLELVCVGSAGCFVNGAQVTRRALRAGDEVRFGSLEGPMLRLADEVGVTQAGVTQSGHSILTALGQLKKPTGGESDLAKLTWFVEAAQRLNKRDAINEILEALIDTTLELTQVERGFVFLVDKGGGMRMAAGRGRGGEALEDTPTISRSAIRRAIDGSSEYIVTDTLSADAAAPSESVMVQNIRAIICIPLRKRVAGGGDGQLLGVLYLDSRLQKSEMTRLDSGLLHTIATEAALLLENATLVQEELVARQYREELELASEIQRSLMSVRIPQLPYAEVEANSIPCKGIGGDFYDVVCFDDRLYVVVADVSGKGVSAAVLASTLQGLIHGQISSGLSLVEIAEVANRYICSKQIRKYATMLLMRMSPDGTVQYINCGHVQPLVQSPGSFRVLESCNMPVGLFEDASYASDVLRMEVGERLLIPTDGVTESEDGTAELFGDRRLQELVEAGASLGKIFEEIELFTGGAATQDDCTMVEVRFVESRD